MYLHLAICVCMCWQLSTQICSQIFCKLHPHDVHFWPGIGKLKLNGVPAWLTWQPRGRNTVAANQICICYQTACGMPLTDISRAYVLPWGPVHKDLILGETTLCLMHAKIAKIAS